MTKPPCPVSVHTDPLQRGRDVRGRGRQTRPRRVTGMDTAGASQLTTRIPGAARPPSE